MNRLVSRLLILVGLLLIVTGTANAQFCSESVLRGSYAFLIEGHSVVDPEAPPVPFMSTAISTFDYHGNEHSEGTINTPEGMLSSTADGVLTMEPDCTYLETYTMTIADMEPMEGQQERCAVLRGGEEINCASATVGTTYRSHAKRMPSPGMCNERMLRGDFAFVCHGWVPSGPEGAPLMPANGTGIISYDHQGKYTGSVSSNYLFAVVPRTFEGEVKVNSDCTASFSQAYDIGGGSTGTSIVVSANEIITLIDGPGAVSCVAKRIWTR